MIKTSDNIRNELDKSFRTGLREEITLELSTMPFSRIILKSDETGTLDTDLPNANKVGIVPNGLDYTDFFSFEMNTYDVDNPKKLFTGANTSYGGIVSKAFYLLPSTSANPYFKAVFSITFDLNTHPLRGYTLYFGNDKSIYPTDFIIDLIDDNETVAKTIKFENNTSHKVDFTFLSEEFPPQSLTRLELSILKMNRPYVRFRLSSIKIGKDIDFTKEIVSVKNTRNGHPISSELPNTSMSFEILDAEHTFDPQNPDNIYQYLLGSETVKAYLTDGEEKILIGTYALNGRPTLSNNYSVSFDCQSYFWRKLALDTGKYTGKSGESAGGVVGGGGERPVEFANRSIQNAFRGLGVSFPDSVRGTIISHCNYSNVTDTAANIVNLFANLSTFQLQENAAGDVYTEILLDGADETISGNEKEYALDKYENEMVELAANHICGEITLDTSVVDAQSYKIAYYPSGGQTAKWYLYPSGSSTDDNSVTADITLDNKLNCFSDSISPTQNANYYAKFFARPRLDWWFVHAKKYTIPYLSDPTIEVGDFVKFTNKYGEDVYGFVAENTYSYPPNVSGDSLVIYTVPNDKLRKPTSD